MTKRIKALASCIAPYQTIADIGCDHGYLLREAFDMLPITFAQAIDNKTGPLNQAKKNLKTYEKQVLFSLSDGLSQLDPRVDVVVIAGMGGKRIVSILQEINHHPQIMRLIIQANRNIDEIRKFANLSNFAIISEMMIEELGIYYEIIVLEKGHTSYNDTEITYGPIFLRDKPASFINKWMKVYHKYKTIDSKKARAICHELETILSIGKENI